MSPRRVAIGAGALAFVVIAAIAAVEAGLPIGGISRGDAIAAAQREIPSEAQASVTWALVSPLVFFRGGAGDAAAPPGEIVWVVRLHGTYSGSCAPAPQPGQQPHCAPPNHTATVMLDYMSGRFVMASIEP